MARLTYYYTDSRVLGGAEQAMFMLLESLDRAVWEPVLLLDDAAGVEPLVARAEAMAVPVRRLAPLPLGLSGARRVPGLTRMLRRERPSVFHAHMSSPVAAKYPLLAAVAARVPAVLGTVQVIADHTPERSTMLQLRGLAHLVDRYLAVSRAIASELVEHYRWPATKVEVVHNAVELGRFGGSDGAALRAELGAEDRPLVLTPARLDAQKGHANLLAAAAQVPDAVFALAGDGPLRGSLEAQAAALGLADRVRFLGYRDDIPALLAACDVFALPSLYEGSSLAVLEAMAAGRAIVSSAIDGTDELIDDGRDGLLVAPGDVDALAAALNGLLADPELRRTLIAGARERVERDFSREAMANRVTAAYDELLAR